MLASHLTLADKYNYLDEKFKSAYRWLRQNDAAKLPDGRYDISEGVYAMVQRYETLPKAKCRYEAHKEYFDIQYLAAGHECFGVATLTDKARPTESNAAGDCYFYAEPELSTEVNLGPGDLVIVSPDELHMPRCLYQQAENVVKVVIKVKVN